MRRDAHGDISRAVLDYLYALMRDFRGIGVFLEWGEKMVGVFGGLDEPERWRSFLRSTASPG